MNILELFAGIGGISHALREFAEPACFVEICEHATRVLNKNHPDVPVFPDVTTFDGTAWSGVDILTAGFPCTGFSTAGKKEGFGNSASGLYSEVVRITKECLPKIVFLENSHVLGKPENERVIRDTLGELGYDVKTMVCKSHEVGALHRRYRWFCLAVKSDTDVNISFPTHERFSWDVCEPEKQIPKNSRTNIVNCRLLGNSVVPEQIYYAFVSLWSKHKNVDTRYIPYKREPLNIKLFHEKSVNKRDNMMKTNVIKPYYSTIVRNTPPVGGKCLTPRTSKMLPVQIQFSKDGNVMWYMNNDWVAWLMGYPAGFL